MAGPKDKRKKYSKDQSKIDKKWIKKLDNIKWLKKDYSDKPLKMGAQYAGGALASIPILAGMMTEKGIRAAKKKITGKSKGGSVKLAKKYFKGGMV